MDDDSSSDEDRLHIFQEEYAADDEAWTVLFESSSSEEEELRVDRPRTANKRRDFVDAYMRVVSNYFNGRESIYNEVDFERRFRCPRAVFNRVHDHLMGTPPFEQYKDPTGKPGIYPLVKLVGCFRFIAYGETYDRDDENLCIGETTLRDYVKQFVRLVIVAFGPQYLNRAPNKQERQVISQEMGERLFPGCLGSWDCKHFAWKNCPVRLAGQHQGHAEGGKKTLILEAICDHRKYIWHANFGDPGSMNDINVLDRSSIVGSMLSGDACLKTDPYQINGTMRDWMYYLVDGIYPDWAIFVSTYTNSPNPKERSFAEEQEKVRKDIECSFGVLVQRFHVLQRPLRQWFLDEIQDVLYCCIILHNMIIEEKNGALDEANNPEKSCGNFPLFGRQQITRHEAAQDQVSLFAARVAQFDNMMQSSYEHFKLKKDLVEHISSLKE
ncbi:plant transposon protein [Nitzschia inconspicua]|uniref:Plant transposon protein n=1 Tax=Nitzschia inconspicua TaxID=303405 RepID=A0A9K3LKN0_9STRA|nr:plant transposon protein [Nitzschia inconspicua]